MLKKSEFWAKSSLQWEAKRYDRFFSKVLYSSLHFRRNFVAWCLSQLSEGTTVVELGCGSGRIYELVLNRTKLNYIGIDISKEAIASAQLKFKNEPNAKWISVNGSEDIKNFKAHVVVSAGFIDWLPDEQIQYILDNNSFTAYLHSYSQNIQNWKTTIHKLFSKIITSHAKVDYSPRKFSEKQIRNLFGNNISIDTHPDLSFGAFVKSRNESDLFCYNKYKLNVYFSNKPKYIKNPFEAVCKFIEKNRIKKIIKRLNADKVLDAGAGIGCYSEMFLKAGARHVTAVDPFVHTKVSLKYQNRFSYIPSEINKYGDAQNKFDAVFAAGLLEFIETPEDTIKHLLQQLRPNGKMFILSPKKSGTINKFYHLFHSITGCRTNTKVSDAIENHLSLSNLNYTKIPCGPLNNLYEITNAE